MNEAVPTRRSSVAADPRDRWARSIDDRARVTTLDSGVVVASDHQSSAISCTVSVWVGVGSRDESVASGGVSHFMEHMAFQGTTSRTAHDVNCAIDAVGGDLNAHTSSETTAFYVRAPSDAQDVVTEILLDVVSAPLLDDSAVDSEREVILEELAASHDDPADVAMTELVEILFGGHGLGREALGTEESLARIDSATLRAHHEAWYRGADVVVAAAGRVDHDRLVRAVDATFGVRGPGNRPQRFEPDAPRFASRVVERDIEQVHIASGWRGLSELDPDRYALAVLLHALGDGSSSRLYRIIRDERGLAYSVFAGASSASDSGAVTLYVATSLDHMDETREVIAEQRLAVVRDGITDDELRTAVGYLCGATALALEDASTRMTRLAAGLSSPGGIVGVSEALAAYRSVTHDDVVRVARRVFEGPETTVAVGPLDIGRLGADRYSASDSDC